MKKKCSYTFRAEDGRRCREKIERRRRNVFINVKEATKFFIYLNNRKLGEEEKEAGNEGKKVQRWKEDRKDH